MAAAVMVSWHGDASCSCCGGCTYRCVVVQRSCQRGTLPRMPSSPLANRPLPLGSLCHPCSWACCWAAQGRSLAPDLFLTSPDANPPLHFQLGMLLGGSMMVGGSSYRGQEPVLSANYAFDLGFQFSI